MSEDLKPPVARYRLEIVITGNTINELVRELQLRSSRFEYESAQGRTTREQTGPRYEVTVIETNPEMTHVRYHDELMAWSDERRATHA
jgi:hypothetical protein